MTEISYFWGGTTVGDATEAPYTDDEFSDFIRDLLVFDRETDGVMPSGIAPYTTDLEVTNPSGATMRVNPGVALVDGKVYRTDANVDFTSSGATVWWVVGLRKSWAAQTVRAFARGTYGSEALAIASCVQTDGTTWEIPLAAVQTDGAGSPSVIKDYREPVLAIQKKDNKAIVASVAGDARGEGAIDLQRIQSASSQVASGDYSCIAGGRYNTASGLGSFVCNYSNVASGADSFAAGNANTASDNNAVAMGYANEASGAGSFALGTLGEASGDYTLAHGLYAGATHKYEYMHGIGASVGEAGFRRILGKTPYTHSTTDWRTIFIPSTDYMTVASNELWTFRAMISGVTVSAAQYFSYIVEGAIINVGGTTTLLSSTTTTVAESDSNYDAQAVADDTNDALLIQVRNNGGATYTVKWTCVVDICSVVSN